MADEVKKKEEKEVDDELDDLLDSKSYWTVHYFCSKIAGLV